MARKGETRAQLLQEAKDNFKRCVAWESYARKNWLDDYKFANADAVNAYQWPNDVRRNREIDQRPCLTINKIRQHNMLILNDMRENKPSPKVIAVGDSSNKRSAEVFEGVIRHIEDISNANDVYQTAANFQVQAGIGYWRVATAYAEAESLEQEIYIRRIADPLSVYVDPDIRELDGSDAKFGFVFENMLREEFNRRWPKYKDAVRNDTLNEDNWVDSNHVRVAEYIRIVEEKDTLVFMPGNEQPVRETVLRTLGAGKLYNEISRDPETKRRTVINRTVEWYLIGGGEIVLEEGVLPGSFVPIVR
ncbi:MAG: portal protein, partial [Burkholderiales bacterium]